MLYSTTTKQKNKLKELKKEAQLRQSEITDSIMELEDKLESLKKEYYEWVRIDCATTNMLNGVIQYNDKVLTSTPNKKN